MSKSAFGGGPVGGLRLSDKSSPTSSVDLGSGFWFSCKTMNHLENMVLELSLSSFALRLSRKSSSSSSASSSSSSSSSEVTSAEGNDPKHRKSNVMLRKHVRNCITSFLNPNVVSIQAGFLLWLLWSRSISSMTDCQFLHESGLAGRPGRTLIWPAQVTFGDVGSAISEVLDLAHSRGLAWPPDRTAVNFLWWRLFGSEGLAGLQMGLGIRVR
nr:hypothetical protein PanWU01x14_144990 [Ipomoea trifida]